MFPSNAVKKKKKDLPAKKIGMVNSRFCLAQT